VLYAISGIGRVQLEGEAVQELQPGDTAMIPPNTRHWHGAAPDRIFVHLAMSEVNDQGEGTAWFEHVEDEHYNQPTDPVR
jgi:quercetin dioxygenase-like cupin family protein